jgi:hypothetical protein
MEAGSVGCSVMGLSLHRSISIFSTTRVRSGGCYLFGFVRCIQIFSIGQGRDRISTRCHWCFFCIYREKITRDAPLALLTYFWKFDFVSFFIKEIVAYFLGVCAWIYKASWWDHSRTVGLNINERDRSCCFSSSFLLRPLLRGYQELFLLI